MNLLPAVTRTHPDEVYSFVGNDQIAIKPAHDFYSDVCVNLWTKKRGKWVRISVEDALSGSIPAQVTAWYRNGRERNRLHKRLMDIRTRRGYYTEDVCEVIALPSPKPVQLTLWIPAPGNDLPEPERYYPKRIA